MKLTRTIYTRLIISKHTSIIHGPRHSSYEWKILADFGSKYSKIRPTKECWHGTATKNKFNRKKENNAIVNHTLDDIILQENNKLSAEAKSHKKIDYEIDENNLYEIDNISLDETKKNT